MTATENTQTVLIDTDVAIDFLRGITYAKRLLEKLWMEDKAYISVLSVYELMAGMRPNEKEATNAFIEACHLEDVTREIAEEAGELRRHLKNKGKTMPSMDCLIAATAEIQGHKIFTRNKRHFPDRLLLSIIEKRQADVT